MGSRAKAGVIVVWITELWHQLTDQSVPGTEMDRQPTEVLLGLYEWESSSCSEQKSDF